MLTYFMVDGYSFKSTFFRPFYTFLSDSVLLQCSHNYCAGTAGDGTECTMEYALLSCTVILFSV